MLKIRIPLALCLSLVSTNALLASTPLMRPQDDSELFKTTMTPSDAPTPLTGPAYSEELWVPTPAFLQGNQTGSAVPSKRGINALKRGGAHSKREDPENEDLRNKVEELENAMRDLKLVQAADKRHWHSVINQLEAVRDLHLAKIYAAGSTIKEQADVIKKQELEIEELKKQAYLISRSLDGSEVLDSAESTSEERQAWLVAKIRALEGLVCELKVLNTNEVLGLVKK